MMSIWASSAALGAFNRDIRFFPMYGRHRQSVGPLSKSATGGIERTCVVGLPYTHSATSRGEVG
jgi:hypothetical protein